MALIHEGIGRVIYDPTGHFEQGTLVVMIPNTPVEQDEIIAENYLRSSKFRASGFDGFMQEYVSMEPDRLVVLPEDIKEVVPDIMNHRILLNYEAEADDIKTSHIIDSILSKIAIG